MEDKVSAIDAMYESTIRHIVKGLDGCISSDKDFEQRCVFLKSKLQVLSDWSADLIMRKDRIISEQYEAITKANEILQKALEDKTNGYFP